MLLRNLSSKNLILILHNFRLKYKEFDSDLRCCVQAVQRRDKQKQKMKKKKDKPYKEVT